MGAHQKLSNSRPRKEGRIRPLAGGTFAFEELPAALDQMEDRLTTGQIVVVF